MCQRIKNIKESSGVKGLFVEGKEGLEINLQVAYPQLSIDKEAFIIQLGLK
ncbi:MAG: hypothetical protein ACJAS3_003087 [Roseivirga sp.]